METDPGSETIYRKLDTSAENPGVEVAKVIADIEEKGPTELRAVYDRVDGVLEHLFSTPPSPDARMRVEFDYESYRIVVEQDGDATFRKTA